MQLGPRHRIPRGPRSLFWLVPALCGGAAIVLGVGLVAVNHEFPGLNGPFLFQGSPSGARTSLDSIVSAMITLTGLVYSISFVALQLTSGQYSPRLLQLFMRDRLIQFTFGVFVATFIYAIVVQQTLSGNSPDGVPRLAVTIAFVFVFASTGLFTLYVGRVAHMMRASTITSEIAHQSRMVLELLYPTDPTPDSEIAQPPTSERVVPAPRPGVIVAVNEPAVAKQAAQASCVVTLKHRIGDFVPEGAALLTVAGEPDDVDRVATRTCRQITLATERTMSQDLAFGFRQLIDIVEKALSPSVNDPTTACQALDAMHDLLRRLATRAPACETVCGPDGAVRLVIPRHQFADLLDVTLREVWRYGSEAAQVPERVARMLDDLAEVARAEHQAAVKHWIRVVGANSPTP
jgi:uncharacterized membrane protein